MAETPPKLSVPRPVESAPLDEIPMARAWLQHLRDSVVFKLEGLDAAQLRWRPAPTANSLGVIVVHLGYAERLWIRTIFAGEAMDMEWRKHMFELPEGWGYDEIVAFYRDETGKVDGVLDGATSFDLPSAGDTPPDDVALGGAAPHRGDRTARRPYGHHPGAPRRQDRPLNPRPAWTPGAHFGLTPASDAAAPSGRQFGPALLPR